uniref:Uncharacterized protein n=1 Tax=Oryza brachyantha TaxID=4533 RepID=J3LIF6_ORYBR
MEPLIVEKEDFVFFYTCPVGAISFDILRLVLQVRLDCYATTLEQQHRPFIYGDEQDSSCPV